MRDQPPTLEPIDDGGVLDDLAATLADELTQAGVHVIAAVLPDPALLVPIAESAGVRQEHFHHPDLGILWCACDVGRQLPTPNLLNIARSALKQKGFWNPDGPIGTGMQWSDESLAYLASLYFPSSTYTRFNADWLLTLNARWNYAESLLSRLKAVLAGDVGERQVLPFRTIPIRPIRTRGVA